MSLIEVKIEHGQTFEVAQERLSRAVGEIEAKFGSMIRRVEWSTNRESVRLEGPGVRIELRIDDHLVHVSGDIPLLAGLFGSSRLKQILESSFKKPLN
ncbi:polyhydroxyalkanoic acid system family protein [Tundrisphaera lichenicola]|uniref:polyhydroxyalkanoic acid system family protein n=1 Tax=Tundrisphaera lichenicola TaxID=2029860 RepID=UPI003EBA1054